MSNSQASLSNPVVSYTDDFHSSQTSSHDNPAPAYVASEEPSQLVEDKVHSQNLESAKIWYQYWDDATQRSICIYAPDFPVYSNDDADIGASKVVSRRQSSRSRGSTIGGSAVSYSSNFDPDASRESRSSSFSSTSSPKLSSSSSSSSNSGVSGASYLRVMSIDQLTTADDLYAEEACKELTRRATLAASSSPPPQLPRWLPPQPTDSSTSKARAIESTAKAMLHRLQAAELLRPDIWNGSPSRKALQSNPAYLQLAGVPAGHEVPSLAVERLRVDTLRLGARMLVAAETHEPDDCPDCRRERERLATADWHRALTRQAKRGAIEKRLCDHHPACIASREMINVARNARLVSNWMRTGKVPDAWGFR